MYDVGGHRNERKKRIHCFDDVTAVIFVEVLNKYDQQFLEDATQNRMTEAIQLFDKICRDSNFVKSNMILFETDFGAPKCYDHGVDYLLKKLEERIYRSGEQVKLVIHLLS